MRSVMQVALRPSLGLVVAAALLVAGCTDHGGPSASPRGERAQPVVASETAAVVDEYAAALDASAPELARRIHGMLRAGKVDEARATLERVAARRPTSSVMTLLGALELSRGAVDGARAAFVRALDLDGGAVPARLGLAHVALVRGDDAEARREIERALGVDPNNRNARRLLGTVAARQGRYDEAIATLESLVRDRDVDPGSVLMLADLYVRSGRAADAVARLRPLVATDPRASAPRVALATALLAAGDPRAAATELDRVVTGPDARAEHHELLGRARLAMHDVAGARHAFERAVALDARRFEARVELARLGGAEPTRDVLDAWSRDLAERVSRSPGDPKLRAEHARVVALAGRRDEAEREYRAALTIAPDLPAANQGLAALLLAAGRPDDAVPLLHAVLRSDPRHRQANLLLADHYEGRGQAPRAIQHLEAAYAGEAPLDVKLRVAWLHGQAGLVDTALTRARTAVSEAPRSALAYTTLGRLQLLRGDARTAAATFETALALDARYAAAQIGLGTAWERAGEHDRAARAWRKAAELAPHDSRVFNNLAWVLARDGRRLDEALAHAQRARALAPDLPAVLDTLGWVHYRRGEYVEAERVLVRAVELAPRAAMPQHRLGLVYQRLGRADRAEAAFKRARDLDAAIGHAPELRSSLSSR